MNITTYLSSKLTKNTLCSIIYTRLKGVYYMLTKKELDSDGAKRIYKSLGKRYSKDFRLLSHFVRNKEYTKYDLENSSFEKNPDAMIITERRTLKNSNKQVEAIARRYDNSNCLDITLNISKKEKAFPTGEEHDVPVAKVDFYYLNGMIIVSDIKDAEEIQKAEEERLKGVQRKVKESRVQ